MILLEAAGTTAPWVRFAWEKLSKRLILGRIKGLVQVQQTMRVREDYFQMSGMRQHTEQSLKTGAIGFFVLLPPCLGGQVPLEQSLLDVMGLDCI